MEATALFYALIDDLAMQLFVRTLGNWVGTKIHNESSYESVVISVTSQSAHAIECISIATLQISLYLNTCFALSNEFYGLMHELREFENGIGNVRTNQRRIL